MKQHPILNDQAPTNDVNSDAFDKFIGIYLELPGDDGESKVLGRGKRKRASHSSLET